MPFETIPSHLNRYLRSIECVAGTSARDEALLELFISQSSFASQ